MPASGSLSPTAVASVAPGTVAWVNTANALALDNAWTSVNLPDGDTTERLQLTGFPVAANIPVGVIPIGIQVVVEAHAAVSGGNHGDFEWYEVYLMVDGAIAGENKASDYLGGVGEGGDAEFTFGAADDTWTLDLTYADIIGDFGLSIRMQNTSGDLNDINGYIDSATLVITYETIVGTAGITLPGMELSAQGKTIGTASITLPGIGMKAHYRVN